MIMAVDRWWQYLQRGLFIIFTDHKSLCSLDDQQLTSDLQRKAMSKLVGLQFKFKYKRGVDNNAGDSLSVCCPEWLQEVLNSYENDSDSQSKQQQLAIKVPDAQGYSLDHGMIKYNGRLVIGDNLALHTKLISALHDSAFSVTRAYKLHTRACANCFIGLDKK